MSAPIVQVDRITRKFGSFIAVDSVSFDILPGEIFGYVGPNGSGKTTTIRMLLGLLRPSSGNAKVLGYDTVSQFEAIRARCGYMSQRFAIYDDLSVWENIQFYAGVYGITNPKGILGTLSQVGLMEHQAEVTGSLSMGWRQRLALGIAIVHHPQLLFLDEPTSGVDPASRRAFWDLLYGMAATGVTILVTTHYLDEIEFCHRVGIMREGKLLALDAPQKLKEAQVPGDIFECYTDDLTGGVKAFSGHPDILRCQMLGDHMRVQTKDKAKRKVIRKILEDQGVVVTDILRGYPTLEDVFIKLARQEQPGNSISASPVSPS